LQLLLALEIFQLLLLPIVGLFLLELFELVGS
jgi:hypothetical protein